ncbi:MAG: ribonuclease P protein component [Parcubacteria group bacterium]
MLPKSRRIPRKLFKPLLASGRYFNSEHFSLRVGSVENEARLAVSVSKKVSPKAVVRNKVRRRVYSATDDLIPHLSGRLFLLIAKPKAQNIKGQNLKDELVELLKKG